MQPGLIGTETESRQAATQQQRLQNQLVQRELNDAAIVKRAYQEVPPIGAGESYEDYQRRFGQHLIQGGISGPGMYQFQKQQMEWRKSLAETQKTENANYAANLEHVAGALSDILQLPQEQREAAMQNALPQLQKWEPDVEWGKVPTDDASLKAHTGVSSHLAGLAKVQAETVNQQAAAAQATAAAAANQQKTVAEKRALAVQELSALADPQTGAVKDGDFASWQKKYPDVAPATNNPQGNLRLIRSGVPAEKQPEYDLNALKAKNGIVGNDDFETVFLPAYAAKLGKTIPTLTPDEKISAFGAYAQARTDPEVRASMLASRTLSQALQQIQLNQMPTPEAAHQVAQDVINHRISPEQMTSMFGGFGPQGQAFKRMVYTEAKKLDPEFNFEQASADYQLGKSQNFQQMVRYMDYVQTSVDNVIQAAGRLANGNVRSLNAAKNWTKGQLNDVDLAKFNTSRLEVADAIAKILQGGGGSGTSDAKLTQAQSILQVSDSPAAIAASMQEIKGLIANRRKTLTRGTYMENAAPSSDKQSGSAPALPASLSASDVGKTFTNRDGKQIRITAVNPQNSKQFRFEQVSQ